MIKLSFRAVLGTLVLLFAIVASAFGAPPDMAAPLAPPPVGTCAFGCLMALEDTRQKCVATYPDGPDRRRCILLAREKAAMCHKACNNPNGENRDGERAPTPPEPVDNTCESSCGLLRKKCLSGKDDEAAKAVCHRMYGSCVSACRSPQAHVTPEPAPLDDTCLLRCNQAEAKCRERGSAKECEKVGDACRKRCESGYGPDPLPWTDGVDISAA